MTQAPLNWIQRVEQTAICLQEVPLFGSPPAFPWEGLTQRLAVLFQAPNLKLSLSVIKVLAGDQLAEGFGSQPVWLQCDLTPLEGSAFFLMGKEDVNLLTAFALTGAHSNKGLLSSSFREGFYAYLCTEVVLAINELSAFGDLALKLGKSPAPPQEEALCIDIEIQHPKHTFFARVVCPQTFHRAFRAYFQSKSLPTSSLLARHVELPVSVVVGHSELSQREWAGIRVGDMLLLDRCSFDPVSKKGTASLCLGETCILRLRIKEDHVKIVNYITYQEETQSMDPNTPPPDDQEEFSSPDIEESGSESHLWTSEETQHDSEEGSLLSAKEVPLVLSVEVAKIKMSLDELLDLSPGNTLELPVRPEQGVSLMLAGKKVAKGELIKLGEMLGVKILKLAE